MNSPGILFYKTNDFFVRKIVLSSLVFCQNIATIRPSENDLHRLGGGTQHKPNVKWIEPEGFETNLSIFNPILRRKTKLILQNNNFVKWYSCGPTVYDSAHIGHASSYIRLDIIRRILEHVFGINVFFLLGITDIDDKIIARSNGLKEDFRNLAKRYEIEFFQDLTNLNILTPTMVVRVSDHIPDIISFIDAIMKKGQAYKTTSESVYFATQNFSYYGKLRSPQPEEEKRETRGEKQHPQDFSLWKAAKPGEPYWDSPWGAGRPGWHIECSAMASKVLGPCLDIHSGGQDLVFPHHENEEAQSCAFHNTSQWVNYWLHTGHLQVKGDVKMSKSLKNTISISQFLQSYTSNHLRMLCLMSPYRNQIEFSLEAMNTAGGRYHRIESFIDECRLHISGVKKTGQMDEPTVLKQIEDTKRQVEGHLADDFDTARALDKILRLVTSVNTMMEKPADDDEMRCQSTVAITAASDFIKKTFTKLGFTFTSGKEGRNDQRQLSAVLDAAVSFRSTVREVALLPDMTAAAKPLRSRLLQACDQLRDDLTSAGIEVKDHRAEQSTWSIKDVVPTKQRTEQ